jgi:hypothetical protein
LRIHARPTASRKILTAILCGLFAKKCVTAAHASQARGDVQPSSAIDRKLLDEVRSVGFFNNTSVLAVPIPISNPTIGSGGAIATALVF